MRELFLSSKKKLAYISSYLEDVHGDRVSISYFIAALPNGILLLLFIMSEARPICANYVVISVKAAHPIIYPHFALYLQKQKKVRLAWTELVRFSILPVKEASLMLRNMRTSQSLKQWQCRYQRNY